MEARYVCGPCSGCCCPPSPPSLVQVSFVGLTQEAAEESAKEKGFKLGISKTSFKANSKVRARQGGGRFKLGIARPL